PVRASSRPRAEYFADVGQVLAAPEQLPVEHKAGHSEDPLFFGSAADIRELARSLPRKIGREPIVVRAGLCQNGADDIGLLDIDLGVPEGLEDDVVVPAQHRIALAIGVQHAAERYLRIPDLLCAADHETAFSRLPAAVHIAVAHAPPLMCGALLLDHAATIVD